MTNAISILDVIDVGLLLLFLAMAIVGTLETIWFLWRYRHKSSVRNDLHTLDERTLKLLVTKSAPKDADFFRQQHSLVC
jgi:hypothetical protein